APVYFLSVNGLAKNFMDRMRNYRGDVRPSIAVAVAGGTGKGCVTALQEICRWMVLVGFSPVVAEPVTRYNLDLAMGWAKSWGMMLVEKNHGVKGRDLYSMLSELERLPYMRYTVTDEILYLARSAVEALARRSIVEQPMNDSPGLRVITLFFSTPHSMNLRQEDSGPMKTAPVALATLITVLLSQ
ncbi:MAG: hypothetical protein QXN67_09310, partial [Thermoproteota archaeon]